MIALGRTQVPFLENTSINPVVLGFTAAAALVTAILFGLAPAVAVSKTDVIEALKQGGQNATPGRGQRRFRGVLVAGEIAIALVLLTGAGLLIKSLWILERLDPGFRPDHVLSVDINPIPSRYEKRSEGLAFFDSVIQRIARCRGWRRRGYIRINIDLRPFPDCGTPEPPKGQAPRAEIYPVSRWGFFALWDCASCAAGLSTRGTGLMLRCVVDINETWRGVISRARIRSAARLNWKESLRSSAWWRTLPIEDRWRRSRR